jgi:hypothetical protein
MNKAIIFLLILFFFLGCTGADQKRLEDSAYYAMNPCPGLPCYDQNNFYKVMGEKFGFSPIDYRVECMECAFPYDGIKGSYTKARLDFNGSKVEVFYKEGLCNKPGLNCGFELCISESNDSNVDLIPSLKEKYCLDIKSEILDLNNPLCKNKIIYDSNSIVQRCMDGYFEMNDIEGKVFSVMQNETTCGFSAQMGKVRCMD